MAHQVCLDSRSSGQLWWWGEGGATAEACNKIQKYVASPRGRGEDVVPRCSPSGACSVSVVSTAGDVVVTAGHTTVGMVVTDVGGVGGGDTVANGAIANSGDVGEAVSVAAIIGGGESFGEAGGGEDVVPTGIAVWAFAGGEEGTMPLPQGWGWLDWRSNCRWGWL